MQRVLIAALIVLPLVVFGPSALRNEFVSLDDTLLITRNPTVQELSFRNVAHVFSSYDPELYVPLTLFTYQIESTLIGVIPQVFHSTNLLLHVGSTVLLFFLFTTLLGSRIGGFIVALLFALHPIQTEAVVWAAARKDVLSTFFFILSLLLYEKSQREEQRKVFFWSIGTFALALLSKVTVLTLPAILLLFDWWRERRITKLRILEKWPFFALSIVFAIIAAFGKTQNIGSLTLLQYALVGAKSTVFYLSKIFWPIHLSVIYAQTTPITITSPEFLVPLVVMVALVALTLVAMKFHRGVAFGLLFFFFTLPVNFFNVWKNGFLFFASDRYVYIPVIGLFAALAALIMPFLPDWKGRTIGAALMLLLAYRSAAQAVTWRSSEALYRHGLTISPDSPLLLVNLGDVLVREGKEDQGLKLFLIAVEKDPKHIVALTNAGNLYKKKGDRATAKQFYQRAIDAVGERPFIEHLMGYYLLAEMLLEEGKTEEGFALLREATERGSEYAEPFFNLGLMLEKFGRGDEAIEAYRTAIERDSTYIAARYHLAGLLAERGMLSEALDQLEAVVSLNPNYEKAAWHLENIKRLMAQ